MSCYSLRRMIKTLEKTGSLEAKSRSGRPSTCKSGVATVSQNVEAIETLSTYGEDKQALSEITFMQDGEPPHISRGAKQLLKDTFGEDRVIRSPDLTPCDFWIWSLRLGLHISVEACLPNSQMAYQILESLPQVLEDWTFDKQRRDREEPKILSNLNAKEQEYQITALIYLMGERAEEIHSAFNLSADDAKNLNKVIEAFDNHFIGKRNVVYERALDKCPAKDKVCGKCGKKSYYTNLCRKKNNEVNAISSEETPAREKVSFVQAVREPRLGSRKSRWKSTVRVNGTAIHFKLDPGSDVTLIPFSLYKRYFSNVQLTPTDGQLMAAANQRLENAGTFVAKLRANTREMKETVEFPKLFEGLGLLEQPYHIKLKEGAKPFSIPVPRRVPLPLMPKLKEQLDAMVAQEVIEPVDEPTEWCAPIVLAGKPNGKIRICVDLSRINLNMERELHPLPVLEHELAQLNGAKIFSRLDANSGFWQIKLSEESQTLTTFITPFGRYKFKRLPFGISSAPEHFQKRMSAILRGVNGVICHMDDILIFAKRKEEHDETLREFGVSNITFLGHYIDEHGIKADEKKVKAIAEMKPPTDVHGVQRFVGMVNFLGRFVPNLAEITKPLNNLRKKDVSFIWGSPQKKAFEKVEDVLASDRVLASFDISKKTMVSADASSYGLGAVLKQEHEANEWRPVAYASQTLTKTEQGYAQIEKLQRYRMRMLQFSFHIFHTPWKDLITADALSRQPLPGHLPEDEELQEEVEHFVRSIVLHQSTTDDRLAKIALNQKLEPTLQNVAFYSKNGWPAKCQLSPLERSFNDVRDEIEEENGLLMRGLRVIIPSNMRKDVLNRIHAGHQGITKCRARAKDHVCTPLANGLSPAELLFGRKIRPMVPCTSSSLTPKTVDQSKLRGEEEQRKMAQKTAFDRRHAATKKAELIAGEKVWVKDLRVWRSVLEKASAPRSYIVETPVGTYRRNSLLLASSQQQVDPSETSPDTASNRSRFKAAVYLTWESVAVREKIQACPALTSSKLFGGDVEGSGKNPHAPSGASVAAGTGRDWIPAVCFGVGCERRTNSASG
ncbi:K02A2.6-like [Cordylochernes scorpioides]|uniref:K02A2.6-like n=1 Tax=Cordylochernes scorpioides TaxID=51811 RepID=A0ABY6LKP1_9ARAC|nr:K02A2.6-like [Cordylochernes scorpioides]